MRYWSALGAAFVWCDPFWRTERINLCPPLLHQSSGLGIPVRGRMASRDVWCLRR